MDDKLPVSRETYMAADERTQRALQYDLFAELYKCQSQCSENVGARMRKLENGRLTDTTIKTVVAAVSGFLGGIFGIAKGG